jgi:hypothetical protein
MVEGARCDPVGLIAVWRQRVYHNGASSFCYDRLKSLWAGLEEVSRLQRSFQVVEKAGMI